MLRSFTSVTFAHLVVFGLCAAVCQQSEDALVTGARPGAAPSSEASANSAKIHVNSDLVVVPVTVTDHKGRIVNGLQKEHFTLYEDKVEQAITHFASEDTPLSISFVLDTSDSMYPKLKKAREAVAALLHNANREDEFSLVEFNDFARRAVSFTTNVDEIRNRLAVVETGGGTALLDAVRVALNEMKNAHHTRKAIVILSDGEDNASHCSITELRGAVREADVLVYAIGIVDPDVYSQTWPPQNLMGSALLNEIAKQSGGRFFQVSGSKELPQIAFKIDTWLHNQYILAYVPNSQPKRSRYHRIEVRITRPEGFPRLRAYWRLGYYTPATATE